MKTFLVFFSYRGKIPVLEFELLRVFCLRMRKVYPRAEIVILTDPATGSILRKAGLKTLESEVRPETLLLDRTRIFQDYIAAQPPDDLVCLIDYDIILNRPLGFVEAHVFDVAYTFRRRAKKYPLNGGVVVVRTGAASASFIQNVLENYQRLPVDQLAWWGDQIGVWNLVGPHVGNLREGVVEIDQVRILLVDGEAYNWTPFDMDVSPETLRANLFLTETLYRQCRDKAVLHFKGPRKHLQIHYFDRLIIDRLEVSNHSLLHGQQQDSPQNQFCSLKMEGFDKWHLSISGHGGAAEVAELTFGEAIKEACRYGRVEIDLRILAKRAFLPGRREEVLPPSGRWEGFIADFGENPLEPCQIETLNCHEAFSALLAGALPVFVYVTGGEISDVAAGIEGHLGLFGLLVALASGGAVEWAVGDRISPVEQRKLSTQDLCAALLATRARYAKSILLRLLVSDALGNDLAQNPPKPVFGDALKKIHPCFDHCDWAVFAWLYKGVAKDVGFAANIEYFDVEPLAAVSGYRDFRGKLLGDKNYQVESV